MGRRKATRKSRVAHGTAVPPATRFPVDCLPSELIHMVFVYLKPTDAAAFRWTGRVVAEIGL